MNASRAAALGLRSLAREWRSGELGILLLALSVAVAALTGVGFLVDRVNTAMLRQASEVLAADLRLQSPQPVGNAYENEARRRGLETARTTQTLTVVLQGDATQLANLVAVSPGYPLRGQLKVADRPFGVSAVARDIPVRGTVWLDSRLAAALGASVGQEVSIGESTLRVGRILISRPDQGSGFTELAPTAMMHLDDLPAAALLQPGSRATHAVLFAGSVAQVRDFGPWLREHRTEGERLRDLAEASPEVGNAATRASRFLSVASLAAVLLCAVAVAMTARRYVQRHLDVVALLKTLGASRRFALGFSITQMLAVALVATALGTGVGFIAQEGLLRLLEGLVTAELPPAGWQPALLGLATAVLLLGGFALPPLMQLSNVPAIRILRRDLQAPPLTSLLAFGPAVTAVVVLVYAVTQDWALAGAFAAGLAVTAATLALAGYGLVVMMGRLRGRVGVAWRYGLANLARRRGGSVIQVMAFGLGLTALLLLAVLRSDLIDSWRNSLPDDAPNFFFVNIPPEERDAFAAWLKDNGGEATRMLPMVRGRMTSINGVHTSELRRPDGRGERFARREQNLSWSEDLGSSNRIVAGRWFSVADHGKPLVSVATDFAEDLDLKLGDRLGFDIGGEAIEVSVASFREVKWDSLQPNFFLMFPPGLLEGTAGTYMTSARYRPADAAAVAGLVRRFPSVSVFDLDDLLTQIRTMIDKAVLAVQSVFVFTLLAGWVVLLAAVQASREERRFESAVLRALGAGSKVVRRGVVVEFAAIGLLAGLLAALAASIAGAWLAKGLLDVPYTPDPLLWVVGVVAGVIIVCAAGYGATRAAIRQSPATVLRQG
ncbi:MAG: hypothetical protein RL026_926 [Pseudomonadota bacterium]